MNFLNATYDNSGNIVAVIDGVEMTIPNDPANQHYAELIEQGIAVAPYAPPVPTIDDTRASTEIDRAAFCNGLADLSIITDAEAIDAARGIWPASMAGFLTLMDTRQQRDAQIEWASCATVQRMHWVVLSMISVGIVTEAQADALCGITP